MNRKIIIVGIVIRVVFFSFFPNLVFAGEKIVPITLYLPKIADCSQIERTTGEFRAVKIASLHMKSRGTIEKMLVKEGDRVKKGQLLAALEKSNFQLGLDQARAMENAATSVVKTAEAGLRVAASGIRQAETRLKTVASDFERAKGLKSQDAISQQQFDQLEGQYNLTLVGLDAAKDQFAQAEAALESAKTQVAVARVGVQNAQQRWAEADLSAPFDGLIFEKGAQENEPSGDGFLYRLVDDKQLEMIAHLPERSLPFLKFGASVAVCTPLRNDLIPASITTIIPTIDPTNLSYTVKAIVDNSDCRLSHGGFAEVEIAVGGEKDVLTVPSHLVKIIGENRLGRNSQEGYLFTVRDGVAHKTTVVLGSTRANMASVLSGLASGTPIVDRGFEQMEDGVRVKVENVR